MIWQDLRFALRSLRRSPAFAVLTVLILGIGIGGLAVSFNLIDSFLLRPLDYGEPERLVHLYRADDARGADQLRFYLPMIEHLRQEEQIFEDLGAYEYGERNLSGSDGEPEHLMVCWMTANMLDLLQVTPLLGRGFSDADARPDATPVVLLRHSIWKRHFGGRRDVVGEVLRLDDREHVIVGVMPEGFQFPFGEVRLWTPLAFDQAEGGWQYRNLQPVGRLSSGIDRRQAAQRLQQVFEQRYRDHFGEATRHRIAVEPLRESLLFMHDLIRLVLVVTAVANLFVLLIICANVTNLLLARSLGRRREVALRMVLGAGRRRIVGQFVVEAAVLAGCGTTLGLLLAALQGRFAQRAFPEALFRVGELGVDPRVVAFALLVCGFCAVLLALPPALQSSRLDLARAIHEGSASSGPGKRSGRMTSGMVVLQVAGAVVLLVGTTLMLRTVRQLERADLGLDASGVLTMNLRLAESRYGSADELRTFRRQVRQRLQAVGGVESAAFTTPLPLNFESSSVTYDLGDGGARSEEQLPTSRVQFVSPDYFATMATPLLSGREFEPTDENDDAAPVVIVNQAFAERSWPGAEAVGRRLAVVSGRGAQRRRETLTVVGLVGDSKSFRPNEEFQPQLYFPEGRSPARRPFLVVRVAGDPAAALPAVRGAVWSVHPQLPLGEVRTMSQAVERTTLPWRGAAGALVLLAVIAVVLAALGLYGVVNQSVRRRTREVAVRRALGADSRSVLTLLFRQSTPLVAAGLGLGLAASIALTRSLSSLLFGVSALDLATFAAVALGVVIVAGLAIWLPAREALRVDPLAALRHE